jgi:hypothetical protein
MRIVECLYQGNWRWRVHVHKESPLEGASMLQSGHTKNTVNEICHRGYAVIYHSRAPKQDHRPGPPARSLRVDQLRCARKVNKAGGFPSPRCAPTGLGAQCMPLAQATPWLPPRYECVCHCVSKHLLEAFSVGNAPALWSL